MAAVAGSAASASADPVILSGVIFENVASSNIATAEVYGTENFSWIGNIGPFAPSFGETCEVRCAPGSTLSFAASTGTESFGTVTIGSQSFRLGGSTADFGFLFLNFEGEALLPESLSPSAAVSAPFTATGTLFFPATAGGQGRVSISGAGTATAFLAPALDPFTADWRVTRLEYRFGEDTAPIPEPSTMLLVASGVVAIARRKFRRRTDVS